MVYYLFVYTGDSSAISIISLREKIRYGKWGIMHECFPKHSRIGTAKMKYDDKETDKVDKMKCVSMKSKAGTRKEVLTAYAYLIKIQ